MLQSSRQRTDQTMRRGTPNASGSLRYCIIIFFTCIICFAFSSILNKKHVEPSPLVLVLPILGRLALTQLNQEDNKLNNIIKLFDYLTLFTWVILLVAVLYWGTIPKNNPAGWPD